MSDDEIARLYAQANMRDRTDILAGLRAVERAARAAALREAAEVCERVHDEHERNSRGLYDPYESGCIDTARELADALRARAEGQSNG